MPHRRRNLFDEWNGQLYPLALVKDIALFILLTIIISLVAIP